MRRLFLLALLFLTPSAWGCSDSWTGTDKAAHLGLGFAAVSIAGVTDQPSIIGTGKTIGAVPYLPIGLGDDEEYWDGR